MSLGAELWVFTLKNVTALRSRNYLGISSKALTLSRSDTHLDCAKSLAKGEMAGLKIERFNSVKSQQFLRSGFAQVRTWAEWSLIGVGI